MQGFRSPGILAAYLCMSACTPSGLVKIGHEVGIEDREDTEEPAQATAVESLKPDNLEKSQAVLRDSLNDLLALMNCPSEPCTLALDTLKEEIQVWLETRPEQGMTMAETLIEGPDPVEDLRIRGSHWTWGNQEGIYQYQELGYGESLGLGEESLRADLSHEIDQNLLEVHLETPALQKTLTLTDAPNYFEVKVHQRGDRLPQIWRFYGQPLDLQSYRTALENSWRLHQDSFNQLAGGIIGPFPAHPHTTSEATFQYFPNTTDLL